MTGTSDTIDAVIRGDVSGQIAVGKDIYQVHTLQLTNHGGIVNLGPAAQAARPTARPTPAPFSFRPMPNLLDRVTELASAQSGLEQAMPVEITGASGIGKSAMLRRVAHSVPPNAYPDGIICLGAALVAGKTLEDLLQTLFDVYFECPSAYKATDAEMRLALQDKRALIIIDDSELDRDALLGLLDAMPGCAFIVASEAPRLWGEGHHLVIGGLPLDAATTLLERWMSRPIAASERSAVEALCSRLEGHPLRIIQAAALLREEKLSLAELDQRMDGAAPRSDPALALLDALTPAERRALGILAAPAGLRLPAHLISDMAGLRDGEQTLEQLRARGLLEGEERGYRLTGAIAEVDRAALAAGAAPGETLRQLSQWMSRGDLAPAVLGEQTDASLRLLDWAGQEGAWGAGMELARSTERAMALTGNWGAWKKILGWELLAARELGDPAAEAWALHQQGTRALCLGERTEAQAKLERALELRESLGDQAGAAVTRHNLRILLAPPPADTAEHEPPTRRISGRLLAGLATIVGVGALAIGRLIIPPAPPPHLPPTAPVVTGTAGQVIPAITTTAGASPTSLTGAVTREPATRIPPTQDRGSRVTPSPTSEPLPDLVVESLVAGAPPQLATLPELGQREAQILVPVRVTIRNRGVGDAAVFKVSAAFEGRIGAQPVASYEAPFAAQGQRNSRYAFTSQRLPARDAVTFAGTVVLPASLAGQTVLIRMLADSCVSEEFQPDHCRVLEQDETNNLSSPLRALLPATSQPTATPTVIRQITRPPAPTSTPTPRPVVIR